MRTTILSFFGKPLRFSHSDGSYTGWYTVRIGKMRVALWVTQKDFRVAGEPPWHAWFDLPDGVLDAIDTDQGQIQVSAWTAQRALRKLERRVLRLQRCIAAAMSA